MISKATILCVLLGLLIGCGREDYSHRAVGLQSKQADEVRQLIDTLTATPDDGLSTYVTTHGATDLTHDQREALTIWLRQLQQAHAVELIALDRFGDQVYRAGVRLTDSHQTRDAYALLVEIKSALYWAGPN